MLSLDPAVGDFEQADVLIDGKKIIAVGTNLPSNGEIVDCRGTIVMPGLHQHAQSPVRGHPAKHHCRWSDRVRRRPGSAADGSDERRVRSLWDSGPEHLDGGPARWTSPGERGRLGSRAFSIRSRGLLYLGTVGVLEPDHSGHHLRNGYIAVLSHAGAYRRHDQGPHGLRTPVAVRLHGGIDRSAQDLASTVRVSLPGPPADREDVLQFERPAGHARLRGRAGADRGSSATVHRHDRVEART